MTGEPYVVALTNALSEIQKAYPDITHSFIFTNEGATISGNPETDADVLNTVSESFETLKQNTEVIGDVTNYAVNGGNGKLFVSKVNDLYFMLATKKTADEAQIYSLTHVVIPPLLKTMQTFAGQSASASALQAKVVDNVSEHLQKQESEVILHINPLGGFFDGDAVQIDEETLDEWSTKLAEGQEIERVKVETFTGKTTICEVKKITVGNLKGKGLIRMPSKVCSTLEIQRGDKVKVTPDL